MFLYSNLFSLYWNKYSKYFFPPINFFKYQNSLFLVFLLSANIYSKWNESTWNRPVWNMQRHIQNDSS